MISRFEWMTKNDSPAGIRLGLIQVDIAIKYEAYITYLEFMESLNSEGLSEYKKRAQAVQLTADKFNISYSTIWRYLAFFDYVTPSQEDIKLYKNQTRWTLLNS